MRLALMVLLGTFTQEQPPSYLTAPMPPLGAREESEFPVLLVAEEGLEVASPRPSPFAEKMRAAPEIEQHIATVYPQCDAVVRERLAVEFALAGEERYQDWCRVIDGETGSTWDPVARGDNGHSFGLFQVNRPAHGGRFDFGLLGRGDDLGVWYQTKCAIAIRKDSGWGAWTVARRLGIR